MALAPWPLLLAFCCACAGCHDGELIALGAAQPRPYRFSQPKLIAELSVPAKTDNPTLSPDLLEIFFTSDREGGDSDIWTAQRGARDEPFEAPARVSALNSTGYEASCSLDADALTMWFSSDRPGGLGDLDIMSTTRSARGAAWSAPQHLPQLNSQGKDVARPPGQHGLVMPLGSDRTRRGFYQTYLAERSDRAGEFTAPELLAELAFPVWSTVIDGFLSDDGLTLFFSGSQRPGPFDLYVAWRKSTDDRFEAFAALEALNTPDSDELDPWLSADGSELYFTSNRSGFHNIYVADIESSGP
jgi:Tol biopolymer transport system component